MKIKKWILRNIFNDKIEEFTEKVSSYQDKLASESLENLQIEMEKKQRLIDQIKTGNLNDIGNDEYHKKMKNTEIENDKLFNKSIFNTIFKNELLEIMDEVKSETTEEYSHRVSRMHKILEKQQKEINKLIKDNRNNAIKINISKEMCNERQIYPSNLID